MVSLLPVLLGLLFALWSGTLWGDAHALPRALGDLALLGFVGWAGCSRDPLRLRRAWPLSPALLLAVVACQVASPVWRSGLRALLLLPIFLLLPAAVARSWSDAASRRRGFDGLAASLAIVAVFGLIGYALEGVAARPLGHHHLLAAWLLLQLPLILPEEGGERRSRVGRLAAVALVVLAVLATRSLAAIGVLGLQLGCLAPRHWRRWTTLGVVTTALVVASVRLGHLVSDSSWLARQVYWRAGLQGWSQRPWLGWGAGATPWTLGRFLAFRPGVNPPGELVADLHSLPLQLAYEGGLLVLLMGAVLLSGFLRQRWLEARRGGDTELFWRGIVGLAGGLGIGLVAGPRGTSAPFVAAALVCGALLSAAPPEPPPRRATALLVIGLVGALLLPAAIAQLAYERATGAGSTEAARWLRLAVQLDPRFPLYRARSSWLEAAAGRPAAREALVAARDGGEVALLWLAAGDLAAREGQPEARAALLRALAADPLDALAPMRLALLEPGSSSAACWGARALLGEPRLLAARLFQERPQLGAAAVRQLRTWPGLDSGWRAAMGRAWREVDGASDDTWLGATGDRDAAISPTLHLFRRRPWPFRLPIVAVARADAEQISVPSAFSLPLTEPSAVLQGCGSEASEGSGEGLASTL